MLINKTEFNESNKLLNYLQNRNFVLFSKNIISTYKLLNEIIQNVLNNIDWPIEWLSISHALTYLTNTKTNEHSMTISEIVNELQNYHTEMINRFKALEENHTKNIYSLGYKDKYLIIDDYDILMNCNQYKYINQIKQYLGSLARLSNMVGMHFIVIAVNKENIHEELYSHIDKIVIGPYFNKEIPELKEYIDTGEFIITNYNKDTQYKNKLTI